MIERVYGTPAEKACPGETLQAQRLRRADRMGKGGAWRQRSVCTTLKTAEFFNKTRLSLMFFHCNPYWIEEICDTPAELLASRDTADACVEEAWQAVGGKGADF